MTFVIIWRQLSGSAEKPMTKIAAIGMKTTNAAVKATKVAEPIRLRVRTVATVPGWAVPGRGSVDKRSALAKAGMALL
jgi:hypothetical protein